MGFTVTKYGFKSPISAFISKIFDWKLKQASKQIVRYLMRNSDISISLTKRKEQCTFIFRAFSFVRNLWVLTKETRHGTAWLRSKYVNKYVARNERGFGLPRVFDIFSLIVSATDFALELGCTYWSFGHGALQAFSLVPFEEAKIYDSLVKGNVTIEICDSTMTDDKGG